MKAGTDPSDRDGAEIDWEKARSVIRSRLLNQLGRVEDSLLDDLVQESCVRLLRAARRDKIRSDEAMMTTIAKRTAIDHIRRRQRAAVLFEPMSDRVEDTARAAPVTSDYLGDPHQRAAFVILEFFKSRKETCHELATCYFQQKNWRTVADELRASYEGVRVRWSRCLGLLRRELECEPELSALRDWLCCE